MLLGRRGFIFGAAATLAVIRTPGLLMPVKPFSSPPFMLETYELKIDLGPGAFTWRGYNVGDVIKLNDELFGVVHDVNADDKVVKIWLQGLMI